MGSMLPLGLSMLWEPVEPLDALRQRFGFDDFDAAATWAAIVLDETWGIAVAECSRIVISDHNAIVWVDTGHGHLIVKWSQARERFASLDFSTRLLRAVSAHGIPAARPIATADGLVRVVLDGPSCALSAAVLPQVTGDWLDVNEPAAVEAAGVCLARVHRALAACGRDVPLTTPAPAGLNEQIGHWLAHADRGLAPRSSRRLDRLLADSRGLDDEPQLVHNDFRAANILTRDSEVTAVLDFDDVEYGYRVDDLAKACVYLGTRFTDWSPTPKAAQQALRAGYESERPLSSTEGRWFDILLLWHGLQAIPGAHDPAGWASAL